MLEFIAFLNSLYPLSAEAQVAMLKVCTEKHLRRGQHWLKEGETCKYLAFVKRGLLKVYFESGAKEVALWYNKEMEAVLSVQSFFSQSPSKLSIKAVEETELIIISSVEIESLYNRFPEYNRHARLILQQYYSLSEAHVTLLLQPPKQRYDAILKMYPWMSNGSRLTDKMLAAYIGVTPNCLYYYKNGRYDERRNGV
jgi:CRP-like cAMP-binding protein